METPKLSASGKDMVDDAVFDSMAIRKRYAHHPETFAEPRD